MVGKLDFNPAVLDELPEHLDKVVGEGVEVDVEFAVFKGLLVRKYCKVGAREDKLTFDVVHDVRLVRLIVMHHLDHLEEIIFLEFLESVGELLHIELLHKPPFSQMHGGGVCGALPSLLGFSSSVARRPRSCACRAWQHHSLQERQRQQPRGHQGRGRRQLAASADLAGGL